MGRFLKWNLRRVVETIVVTLLSEFDFFLVIEGERGLGKSTCAWILCKRVAREFKKLKRYDIPTIEKYYEMVNNRGLWIYRI